MTGNELFTEEQLDYLVEMLNIGAGNATTALSRLLQSEVNMKLPAVQVLPPVQAAAVLGDLGLPVACLRMKMVGDMSGSLFFIVPDSEKLKMADLAQRALLGSNKEPPDPEQVLSVLAEIGNILAGVYLTAIHDFCKLNMCHSVPVLAADMMQSLLDESFERSSKTQTIIVVKNEFTIGEDQVQTFFLIFPSRSSINALLASMAEARKTYGNQ